MSCTGCLIEHTGLGKQDMATRGRGQPNYSHCGAAWNWALLLLSAVVCDARLGLLFIPTRSEHCLQAGVLPFAMTGLAGVLMSFPLLM